MNSFFHPFTPGNSQSNNSIIFEILIVTMLKNKYYYVIILLNRIHVNGNTVGLYP